MVAAREGDDEGLGVLVQVPHHAAGDGDEEAAARAHLSAYSMEGLAANITCPTLISHGAQDLLMNVEGAKRLFEEIGSDDKTLKIWDGTEGGTGHCSYDNWPTSIPYMLDWLKTRI